MSQKGNASKRAKAELFEVEEETVETVDEAALREAARREKLRREMLGDKGPESGASAEVRPAQKRAMQPERSNTIPTSRAQTGTIPRVQTGTIPRVQTGTIPRVQTGTIPRVQTGTIPRVQTGTITFPKVKAAPAPKADTGTITFQKAQTATITIPKVDTGKFNKVAPRDDIDENEKTKKFGVVPAAKKAEKKSHAIGKIAAALGGILFIGVALFVAIKFIGAAKEEEPKIIPTDVVAGTDEAGETVLPTPDAASVASRHTVKFTFYEKPEIICTTGNIAAGELMDQLGIEYKTDKIVSISADAEIAEDVTIEIKDVGHTVDYVTEAVPNETKYVDDDTMYKGTEVVDVEGYNGVKTYTYNVKLVNGVEDSRELASEEITTSPVDRVIRRGTRVPPLTPHSTDATTPKTIYTGVPENYLYYVDVRATCYCIVGTTATGLPTGDNVMAVDPSVIPLGSECVVIGDYGDYGHRIAADVGGGIKGNIIDIWLPEGTGFGWQNARVYVLSEG